MKTLSKILAIATLATGLNMAQTPKANAGSLMTLANPAVGAIIALSGFAYSWTSTDAKGYFTGMKIFILDEKSNDIEFNPISNKDAAELGLTKEEAESYNEEIDRVNAGVDELNSDLLNAPKTELEEIENKSLVKFREQISPAAFSAVQKILKASVQ